MNITSTKSVVEFYHLPGLGVKEQATVILTAPESECHERVAHLRKVNLIVGESQGYRYSVLSTDEATAVVKQTNAARDRDLAEFRHRVYGEPMPV